MNNTIPYQEYADKLEDFWWRRRAAPRFQRDFWIMGRAVRLVSNEEGVLTAVDHTTPLYTTAPATNQPPFIIQLVLQPVTPPPPLCTR